MQCENGYTKDGVRGILCRKVEEPKDGDLGGVAHALCGHQRFCPNQRCYQMLPGWEKCTLRREKPVEAAETEIASVSGKETPKKKSVRKRSKEDQTMAVRIIDEKWINPEDESLNALRYVQGFCLADDEKPTENIYSGSSLMAVDSVETYYFTESEPGSWAVVPDGDGAVEK